MSHSFPELLFPYVRDSLRADSVTLVTSTLSTPATWLLVRFIKAALELSGDGQEARLQAADGRPDVVFVSVYRPQDLWIELFKKIGLDFAGLLKQRRICYIDRLAQSSTTEHHNLRSLSLDAVSSAIKTVAQQQQSAPTAGTPKKPTVIIDGLDLVLASQPDANIVQIQHCVAGIRFVARTLIISASGDSPLMHNRHDSATPLEQEHAKCVATIAHQSSWVYQLRGLDTGSARDVTGVLRVSRGGADEEDVTQLDRIEDAEWLYQLKGDGGVRAWSRGD